MRFFVFSEKSMFDPILVPTWLHFGTQNPPKSMKKSIPRDIQKMIDFWIDFLPKLAPFWDPCWDPRAAQDGPKTPPRRHQDSPRATRVNFNWFFARPRGVPHRTVRWGTCPGPRFSKFVGPFWYNCWCEVCAKEVEKHLIKFQRSRVRRFRNNKIGWFRRTNF